MTMRELNTLVQSGAFVPFTLFYGDEPFLISFYARRLCDKANETFGMADFNFTELEGDKVTVESLADVMEAMPMFAPSKCVLLKDFDFAGLNKDDADFFLRCAEEMPDTTVLVLTYSNLSVDPKSKKWEPLFDLVRRRGRLCDCCTPSRDELCVWLMKAAEREGASLDRDNACYLLDRVGTDMRRLRMEMGKLSAYADGEILPEHIDAIAVKQLDAKVYDMVRALSSRRFQESYHILAEIVEMGEEPEGILGAVGGTFADIYRAKLGNRAGKSAKEIAADFKLKDFRVTNALRDGNRYSEAYLTRCIEIVTETDNELKKSPPDKKIVLEKMIAQIAAAGALNG